jgi:hypothetical protein
VNLPPCAEEGCTEPIVVLILSDFSEDFAVERVAVVDGACDGHAPEVVHEYRNTAHESEFIVVPLPATTKETP